MAQPSMPCGTLDPKDCRPCTRKLTQAKGTAQERAVLLNKSCRTQPADLKFIAESRTPECRYSSWGSFEGKRCVLTLGMEDLRIYVAHYKPPLVYSLSRVSLHWGPSHLELRRTSWGASLLRSLCCCEPFTAIIKMRCSQVDDLREHLFPQREVRRISSGISLSLFPSEVLYVIAECLALPTIHEVMRGCSQLRITLRADSFWQDLYVKLFPPSVRLLVEEFVDLEGCAVLDKVAVATLRFCSVCHARRIAPGFCSCGARPIFNQFVHFDMRAAEKLRLGLHVLNMQLVVKGFDLQAACLCFSSRYHGNSLSTMLRQTATLGRMQLLVCESFSGHVFGVLFGFPLQRRSGRAYGKSDKVMLFSISPERDLRVFEAGDASHRDTVQSLPDALVIGTPSDAALALNWDLSTATCASTPLCHGSCLCGSEVNLRSVVTFADMKINTKVADRRISQLTASSGSEPESERAMARQLLQLSGHQDMRHYFG
mmetsp:Transcript_50682/g.94663  ORF Transcript_50682/g.94663 Transcript_50682/m.94663 type:complete len:485 (-) Transcript_50682:189-1643(-)